MTYDLVVDIGTNALKVALFIAAPLLLAILITGLLVSIFQAVTQLNETTLSFVPKLIVASCVAAFSGSWMLNTLCDYFVTLYHTIPQLIS